MVRQQTLPLGAILRDPDSADAVVEAVQDVDLPRAIRAALRTDSDKVSLALDLTHAEGEVRYTDPETGGQKGQKPAELGALPPEALLHLAEVAGYGTRKYDRYNYLKGYKWSLSFDAMPPGTASRSSRFTNRRSGRMIGGKNDWRTPREDRDHGPLPLRHRRHRFRPSLPEACLAR